MSIVRQRGLAKQRLEALRRIQEAQWVDGEPGLFRYSLQRNALTRLRSRRTQHFAGCHRVSQYLAVQRALGDSR